MHLSFAWHPDIHQIPAAEWDALASPLPYPFLEWAWLAALEDTGRVSPERGWQPLHLTVRRGKRLVAAAALYLKGHSRGEFVFDQEWAEAAQQLGLTYYPKLLGMSPFTPAPGYRFLIDPDEDAPALCRDMLAEIDRFCADQGLPGCHFLHTDDTWAQWMVDAGMRPWVHHHLIWERGEATDFDGYLAGFRSKQRKNIKRERRTVQEQGLHMRMIPGTEADPALYRHMYTLYADTCQKFWNWSRYLNRAFFERLGETFAHRIMFSVAEDPDEALPRAASFLIYKGDAVYGRYWGSLLPVEHLHFETCYYQPIEWAVKQGLGRFDAGSGNARHKQRRGFPARPNLSLHRHYHPVMQQLWAQNIDEVNHIENLRIEMINRGEA